MSSLASLGFHQVNSSTCILGFALFFIYVLWISASCALSLLALKSYSLQWWPEPTPCCVVQSQPVFSHGISSSPGECASSPSSSWPCFTELQVGTWSRWVSDPFPTQILPGMQVKWLIVAKNAPSFTSECLGFCLFVPWLYLPLTADEAFR